MKNELILVCAALVYNMITINIFTKESKCCKFYNNQDVCYKIESIRKKLTEKHIHDILFDILKVEDVAAELDEDIKSYIKEIATIDCHSSIFAHNVIRYIKNGNYIID